MEQKKKYMEQVYEQFAPDIKPTDEMRKIYKSFSTKIQALREKIGDKELVKDLDDLENVFSELTAIEVKQGFFKGFSVAMNINRENYE